MCRQNNNLFNIFGNCIFNSAMNFFGFAKKHLTNFSGQGCFDHRLVFRVEPGEVGGYIIFSFLAIGLGDGIYF